MTLGNEPKTSRSKRTVPMARLVMRSARGAPREVRRLGARRVGLHGPTRRATGAQPVQSPGMEPAVIRAGIPSITLHGLRHSFVAILVAAGCNVREVSEWAGHHSVAFTLTRYGGLFEDGPEAAVDRLDVLLGGAPMRSDNVIQLDGQN